MLASCALVGGNSDFQGGEVDKDTTLRQGDSPFLITENILIRKDATLTVEPGVEMQFAPGIMLAVNGTLTAKVIYS